MMRDNGRIAIFISFSGQGGVERMINNLAAGLLEAGYTVDMIIARASGGHIDSIPEGVNQIRLGTRHTLTALRGLVHYLRSAKPAAILAVKDRAIKVAVIARWLSGRKVYLAGRIGTTVSAALEGKSMLRMQSWKTGMSFFYRHADKIIAVSHGVAEDILSITGLPPERVAVVSNPVVTSRVQTLPGNPILIPGSPTQRSRSSWAPGVLRGKRISPPWSRLSAW